MYYKTLENTQNSLYIGPYGYYLVIMDFAEVPTTMIYEHISTIKFYVPTLLLIFTYIIIGQRKNLRSVNFSRL